MKQIYALAALIVFSSCATVSTSQVEKALNEDPDMLVRLIEKHPAKFAMAMGKAGAAAAEAEEKERLEADFKNPLQPDLSGKRAFQGNANAPITIVEYTDFECPYCQQAHATMQELKKEYGGKIRLVYKSLPLPGHPLALPAAQRFEAIALQDPKKAFAFHDEVFKNQDQLGESGEEFLDRAAKKSGANVARMKKDLESEKVMSLIEKDMAEAQKFEFSGTPAFIINGIAVRGAYPIEHFRAVIDRLLAAQK